MVGDGEAETGPLAASWHSNKFLNPARDGAVLPILHLNGYKIANPTVLARIPEDELRALLEGYGHAPRFVAGDDPDAVHQALAAALDGALDEIAEIQRGARAGAAAERPRWPMIVLRTPKGWTGPKEVDGNPAEGNWRSHQVPLSELAENPEHLRAARGVDALLPPRGAVRRGRPPARRGAGRRPGRASAGWAPTRTPTAACCCATCALPDFRDYAVDVARAGADLERGDAGAGRLPARRHAPQRGRRELPRLRPRRDGVEPPRRRARGDRPRLDGGRSSRATTTSRPTAA